MKCYKNFHNQLLRLQISPSPLKMEITYTNVVVPYTVYIKERNPMAFIWQYGIFIVVILLAAGIVACSAFVFSNSGKIVSSVALGLSSICLLLYSFLGPEDPFAGMAYGALAFCIVLGVSIPWGFLEI